MNDYILLMHNDASDDRATHDWDRYIAKLKTGGYFEGGSAIGTGTCVNKLHAAPTITTHLSGYIRIRAEDLSHVQRLLDDNPVLEAGGTVEIRELPRNG